MSSWLELQEWYLEHAVDEFPWEEWIQELEHIMPMPVYSIARILDPCQAYDMAVHAVHWPCGEYLQSVNVPPMLVQHIKAIGLRYMHQVVYMARAMYSHCSRYVAGVPRVCCPPTGHLDHLEAVPLHCIVALARATLTPLPAEGLHAWLAGTVIYGCRRVYRINNVYRSRKRSGRKGRKHLASAEANEAAEKVMANVNQAFAGIVELSPRFAPLFSCYVACVAPGHISLVLSAVPRAPFDE